MSLASRVTNLLFGSPVAQVHDYSKIESANDGLPNGAMFSNVHATKGKLGAGAISQKRIEKKERPPYTHCMLAGGLGGTTGDLLMHSLDTVKTRQQGDIRIPPKYTSMAASYATIFKQEGIRRGLYGGWLPALLGSFPGTIIFFGTYEYAKRHMIDNGVTPQFAYLISGLLADLAASFIYVPSEVLKTRLQLQGRYNNPFFQSGYNYRGTTHAARTIVRQEGISALFYGYKATIFRDLPFSALQFTFYEQGQIWARQWKKKRDIGLSLELVTGAAAGGLAGVITCPLDVVKTRIQTQVNGPPSGLSTNVCQGLKSSSPLNIPQSSTSKSISKPASHTPSRSGKQVRSISTSSPSTHTPRPGCINLDTSSILTGLKLLYQTEGIAGWFRGVGPRFVWTSVQSGCMLFSYQAILKRLEVTVPTEDDEW